MGSPAKVPQNLVNRWSDLDGNCLPGASPVTFNTDWGNENKVAFRVCQGPTWGFDDQIGCAIAGGPTAGNQWGQQSGSVRDPTMTYPKWASNNSTWFGNNNYCTPIPDRFIEKPRPSTLPPAATCPDYKVAAYGQWARNTSTWTAAEGAKAIETLTPIKDYCLPYDDSLVGSYNPLDVHVKLTSNLLQGTLANYQARQANNRAKSLLVVPVIPAVCPQGQKLVSAAKDIQNPSTIVTKCMPI